MLAICPLKIQNKSVLAHSLQSDQFFHCSFSLLKCPAVKCASVKSLMLMRALNPSTAIRNLAGQCSGIKLMWESKD